MYVWIWRRRALARSVQTTLISFQAELAPHLRVVGHTTGGAVGKAGREVIQMLLEDGEPSLEGEYIGTQTLVLA